ncbi:hypothetical protein TIFTF001_014050 [Ficus carica]|uniref:RING-type E3 ubiquitin transferase n=1 Tax=Ficus carica TaxID=3494 RepID=A0AA88A323_FICCA|nr:hypothetical protein TIFTF001_014050 [Ficus carica]
MAIFKNHINFHPWILLTFSFSVFLFFSSNFVSSFSTSTPSEIPYSDHCASFLPGATKSAFAYDAASPIYLPSHNGYYTAIDPPNMSYTRSVFDASNSLVLRLWGIYETDVPGMIGVEGALILRRGGTYYYGRNVTLSRSYYSNPVYDEHLNSYRRGSMRFKLHGFWSQSSGKLCLVGGRERGNYPRGESQNFPALLKLNNIKNSSTLTDLVTGTLESLLSSDQGDSKYFDPVSVMLFPRFNYEYALVSHELNDTTSSSSPEGDVSTPGFSLSSLPSSLCSLLFTRTFSMTYASHCSTSSEKKCNPLGESLSQLPGVLLLNKIDCLGPRSRLRLLIKLPISVSDIWYYRTLDPNTTLVGEGTWDEKKNQLFVVACRFLNATDSWAEARVGDCSTRLSLQFPAIWTIGNTSSIVGHVWSNKTETDSAYFDKIRFENSDNLLVGARGLKYKYTKIDKVRKWCPGKQPAKNKGEIYPSAASYDMRFDIFAERANRKVARGYAEPLTVGNQFYGRRWYQNLYSNSTSANEDTFEDFTYVNPTNISFVIGLFNRSWGLNETWDISAEGVYDSATGSLCMVGCRHVGLNHLLPTDSNVDCEILVKFQFPTTNSEDGPGYIKGTIESKRKNSDPLHFELLDLSSAAYVIVEAQESILRTDVEIIMALVSNSLACVFTVSQLFHLRRHPDVRPFLSLTMMVTLTSGYAIPLLMDLKSMIMTSFEIQNALLESGGWLEAKGLTEGVTAVILFLLQCYLLHTTWSARSSNENRRALQIAENEAVLVSSPLFAGCAFLSIFFTWRKRKHDLVMPSSAFITSYNENAFWDALKSYADLLLDGFLFPQILLNMFRDSREKLLSSFFYVGTTLVRLLPHAYGLYRAQNSGFKLVSIAWDVIIPLECLLFAAIVYLQQRFGGRCILPSKFRGSSVYDKVPNAGDGEM